MAPALGGRPGIHPRLGCRERAGRALGRAPITIPAYSEEQRARRGVHTFKRDYVHDAELRDAEGVLAQLAGWIEDYNRQAPSGLVYRKSLPRL